MKPEREPDERVPGLPVQMDACRPGSDDLRLPELRELAVAAQVDEVVARRLVKSHRIDSMVGQAIRDVDVPADLEGRILSRLSLTELPACAGANDSATVMLRGDSVERTLRSASLRMSAGRRMIWIAVSACAAAIVIGFFAIRQPAPHFSTQDDVAWHAQRWLSRLDSRLWKKADFPNDSFPLPLLLGLRKPYQWQAVTGMASSSSVVCYELTPSTHLFVCRGASAPNLTSIPPLFPAKVANGRLVGGWQNQGLVYVLAVRGNLFDYQSLVKPNQKVAVVERRFIRA